MPIETVPNGNAIMKELLILRHAKSDHSDGRLRDHDRPLNTRGSSAAPRMGRHLLQHGLIPDLLLCSTAVRTMQTAALVAEAAELDAKTDFVDELYLASPQTILETAATRGGDAQRILMIGHNPGCEDVLMVLGLGLHEMPTCALAHIQIDIDDWALLPTADQATLANLWLVRKLPDE